MNRRRAALAWICCSLLLTPAACGKGAAPSATSPEEPDIVEPAADVDRELDQRLSVDHLGAQLDPYIDAIGAGFGPGYRPMGFVSVSAAGEARYERGFGFADASRELDNDRETSFRIGALTQQFTAAAVLRLAATGKLSLDDRVSRHLPDYPAHGASITIDQLLSHSSGLPSYLADPALRQRRGQEMTARQVLETFWDKPLEFAPGSEFRYSDSGYAVLGAIIEKVTGKSYAEHLESDLFARFGLEGTSAGEESRASTRALGYTASDDGALVAAPGFHSSVLYAAAGVRSTAADLQRWHDALQTGRVIPTAHRERAARPNAMGYAYGWFIREEHGHTVHGRGGGLDGFVSHFTRIPELDLSIVVLSNNSTLDAGALASAALAAALGEPVKPPPKLKPKRMDAGLVPRLIGTYRLSEQSAKELALRKLPTRALAAMRSVRVFEDKGKLLFKPYGQAATPMVAVGPDRFALGGGKATLEVTVPPEGAPITRLLLEQGPLKVEYTRRARQRGKPQPTDADLEEPPESEGNTADSP